MLRSMNVHCLSFYLKLLVLTKLIKNTPEVGGGGVIFRQDAATIVEGHASFQNYNIQNIGQQTTWCHIPALFCFLLISKEYINCKIRVVCKYWKDAWRPPVFAAITFYALSHSREKRPFPSSSPSVFPHVSVPQPLEEFLSDLILETFMKICREI